MNNIQHNSHNFICNGIHLFLQLLSIKLLQSLIHLLKDPLFQHILVINRQPKILKFCSLIIQLHLFNLAEVHLQPMYDSYFNKAATWLLPMNLHFLCRIKNGHKSYKNYYSCHYHLSNTLINTCYKWTCGPVRDGMSKQYWTLQNNKLFDLYMLSSTVIVVKRVRLNWTILTLWIDIKCTKKFCEKMSWKTATRKTKKELR